MINYSISLRSAQPGIKADKVTKKKVYATAQSDETMPLSEFAQHIASHGSVYSRADVQAILILTVDCLREQLLEGKRVQLGDLGTFGITLQSRGTTSATDFTAQNITGIRVNWARGKAFGNLRKDATFQLVSTRESQATAIAKEKAMDVFVEDEEDDMRSE